MSDATHGRPTAVARADLVRALEHRPADEDERIIAACLGFGRVEPDRERPDLRLEPGISTADGAGESGEPLQLPPKRPSTPLWRVVEVVENEQPDPRPRVVRPSGTLGASDFGPAALPRRSPSLTPWAQLRRVMEEVCKRPRPIGEIDVDIVVDRLGRGLPIERLPRRSRRVRAPRVVVVIDRTERLIPFWDDQVEVYWNLHDELGAAGLSYRWWRTGPPVGGDDEALVAAVDPAIEAGDVVLVLGDLGHYGAKPPRADDPVVPGWLPRAWARLGHALRWRGVIGAALLPVPAARWEPELVRDWQAVDWTNPAHGRLGIPPTFDERVQRRERLLALVSWTQRLEPALLREVRQCLPASEADAGTEADVWCYDGDRERDERDADGEPRERSDQATRRDEGVHQDAAGLLLPDATRRERHEALKGMLATRSALVRRVVGCVRRHHRALAREVWIDEVRGLLSLDATGAVSSKAEGDEGITEAEQREVIDFTQQVRAYIEQAPGQRASLGDDVDLEGWLRVFLEGQPKEAWSHPQWGKELGETWAALDLDGSPVPPGLDVSRLRPRPEGVQERSFVVAQVGGELHVGVEGGAVGARGSPLVTVAARGRWIVVGGLRYVLEEDRVRRIPLPTGDAFEIATDRVMKVALRLEPKPAWASAMGRDREGLWVEYRGYRLEWPMWAREVAEDGSGLWATFRVGEVEQRMRWIAPGTFMMGSPKEEAGRYEDEGPQHEVTLTEGYWLADTPCTQAMWQAVMGSNPSAYPSPRRPVEQVSWDDVQRFLEKLNEVVPGLDGGLPTEAQWEYACRAGTTTATYAGDMVIRGANDAPVLDGIAWYGGNSGVGYELAEGFDSSGWPNKQYPHTRAGTREVGIKRPNPWGLYDMLGNVYEWCADMPRDYTTAAQTDPQGTRGPERVYRGGSWLSDARYVRAAYRYWFDPGIRYDYLGLRLVRGQGLRKQAKPATREQQGREQGRGTSPASPGGRGKKGL